MTMDCKAGAWTLQTTCGFAVLLGGGVGAARTRVFVETPLLPVFPVTSKGSSHVISLQSSNCLLKEAELSLGIQRQAHFKSLCEHCIGK